MPGGRRPGRPIGSGDAPWRAALNLALKRTDQEGKIILNQVALKCVKLALEGDMQAIKEIGDRLDGKPAQSVTGEGGGPITLKVVTGIDRADR